MKSTLSLLLAWSLAILLMSGCTDPSADQASRETTAPPPVDASQYLLTTAPADATAVRASRAVAEDQDSVVITGRIGGSTHPFVEGVAAFTIVDESMPPCPDDCGCPTPWDYCCESAEDIVRHSAIVKFVDSEQRALRFDPRAVFDIKELQTVVVQGKALRDDAGNYTVLAEKIYVAR